MLLLGQVLRLLSVQLQALEPVAPDAEEVAQQVFDLQLEPAMGIVGRVVEFDFAQQVVVQQVVDLRLQGTGLVAQLVVHNRLGPANEKVGLVVEL